MPSPETAFWEIGLDSPEGLAIGIVSQLSRNALIVNWLFEDLIGQIPVTDPTYREMASH
jgi:hypothetical protein